MAQKQEMKGKPNNKPSTQAYLPIAEIRDGVVILKDGTLRSVLMVSSINFSLKSEDEQNALVSAYVGFLNSLDFPLQIIMQSRKLQIKPYLEKLAKIEREQTNELLQAQVADYKAFIEEFVEIGQIMTKRFYVVVPYDPLTNNKKSFWSRFKEVIKPAITLRLKDEKFKKRIEDLEMRVRQVRGGLESMGLQIVQLDTQSLIELFYSTYNPDTAFSEQLGKTTDIQLERI